MTESACPICGRPEGGGHGPRCGAVPPAAPIYRIYVGPAPKPGYWQLLLSPLAWGLWAGQGPAGERPLFWYLRLGPVEVRLMRRRS